MLSDGVALPDVVLWFWLACTAVGFVTLVLPPMRDAVSYGKLHNRALQSWWNKVGRVEDCIVPLSRVVRQLVVPKAMFTHFYGVAVVWSGALLALSAVKGTCYTQQLLGVPESQCSPDRVILLTALMVQLHVTRRLFECLFVHRFSKTAVMHYLVYAFGVLHYVGVGITVYMPGGNAVPPFYGELAAVGTIVLLAAGFWQNRTHTVLARLRPKTGRRAKRVPGAPPRPKYAIPKGWGFGTVACPHYTADALVYLAVVALTGGTNVCAAAMALWVVTNLTITATRTLAWYRAEFRGYPANMRAIWPGLW